MKMRSRILLGCLGVGSLLLLDAAPAAAATLEEVVVTARKREESLQDVPVAIQALDNAKIERYDATTLGEIADMANNVQITAGTNGSGGSFIIRGYGSPATDSGIESSVALNIDGVQTARGFVSRTAFFDLESVQILKGPQALFFGKDSPAGVVGVTSASPTDQFEAKVLGGYETGTDEYILEGMVSGPLAERLNGRLAVRYSDQGGWVDNNAGFVENSNGEVLPAEPYDLPGATTDIGEITTYTGRLTLDWMPTDDLQVTAKLFATEEKSDGLSINEFSNCSLPGVNQVALIGVGVRVDPFGDCELDNETSVGTPPREILEAWNIDVGEHYWSKYQAVMGTLAIEWQRDWGTISSITGYLDYSFKGFDNFGGNLFPAYLGYNPDWHEQLSQELRLNTELSGPVNFMVGIYADTFERDHESSIKLANFGPDPATGISNDAHVVQRTEGDSWSAFAQVRWDVTDQWELAAGGRFTHDEKEGTQQNVYLHTFFALSGGFVPVGQPVDADFEDEHFSPEVTVTWRPTDTLTLWSAYKTGYKSGGYSTPTVLSSFYTPDSIVFEPEEAEGFEIGVKSTLLDGRMRLNATAYSYEFTNLQVSVLDVLTTAFYISNAAEAQTTGFEFDVVFQATDELQIYAEFGYNDGEYESYPGAACFPGQPVGPNDCIDFNGDGTGDAQDLSGARLGYAPKWSGSLGFEYVRPLNANWLMLLSAEGIYTDEYRTTSDGHPEAVQDSFWRLRSRIGLQSSDGTWDFSVIGRNLTDEIYPTGGARPGAVTRFDQGGGGSLPRTVLFQATYRM